jgi:hypothetical protein
MSHTPTPWNTNSPDETLILGPDFQVVATTFQDEEDYQANHDNRYEDAQFIIKACNTHDELVEALKAVCRETTKGRVFRIAEAALAKAGAL